jgi:hypothetical protein
VCVIRPAAIGVDRLLSESFSDGVRLGLYCRSEFTGSRREARVSPVA